MCVVDGFKRDSAVNPGVEARVEADRTSPPPLTRYWRPPMPSRLIDHRPLSRSSPPALGAQTADPTVARIDSALRALEAKGFSGVVRVDRGGSTLLERGYGLANREAKTPFSPSTVVQIGSNTKDFTVGRAAAAPRARPARHPRLAREVLPQRAGGQAEHHALAARAAHAPASRSDSAATSSR